MLPAPPPTPPDAYRVTEGGWLRLALKNVGGDGQVAAIELVSPVPLYLRLSVQRYT
jgi:hypothetical protein